MTQLASKTVTAQVSQTVAKETTAQTATHQRHNNEVVHAVSNAESRLAKSCHMGIVAKCHSQTDTVSQHSSNGDNTLPRHVR